MPLKRLIPSMLLKGGRLVKGSHFKNYRDAGQPQTTARSLNAQGADEMLLMDIEASQKSRPPDFESIRAVANECYMPLTVGGGISNLDIARKCMEAGADKLFLNTGALDKPSLIIEMAKIFGVQAIVLGVDVVSYKTSYKIFDYRSKVAITEKTPIDWIDEVVSYGIGEIRIMSVEREGSRSGMDIEFLKKVRDVVSIPVIIEGGAGSLEHLDQAFASDADGVAIGTMLVFSDNNLVKIKRYLAQKGHQMRLD